MEGIDNAVWLYMSMGAWTQVELNQFIEWCTRNRVKKVLLQINTGQVGIGLKDDENITNLIERCVSSGIEVHGMISTLYRSISDPSRLVLQDRNCYCVDYHGISLWDEPLGGIGYMLDPTSDRVKEHISDMCCSILSIYPQLSGIHLDFVRYFYYDSKLEINTKNAGHLVQMLKKGSPIRLELENGGKVTYYIDEIKNSYMDPPIGDSLVLRRNGYFCFCERCLERFQISSGISIPSDLHNTNEKAEWILNTYPEAWDEFHAQTITDLISHIRNSLNNNRENSQLSAAIWYNAPYGNELRGEPLEPFSAYRYFGQKWWQWAEDGLVDFICPMDYWLSPESYQKVVDEQAGRIKGKIPMFYGILRTGEYTLTADLLDKYVEAVKNTASGGLCFFHYGTWKDLL